MREGIYDPRKPHPAADRLDPEYRKQIQEFKDQDVAAKPQHALPNSTVRWIAQKYRTGTTRDATAARLIVLAFFFMLRVGEYTPPTNTKRKKRTIELRKKDIRLFRDGIPLDSDATWDTLLTANGVAICLENQKNGHKNQTLYHDASTDALLCPVAAARHLIYQIRHQSENTPLGTYARHGRAARVRAYTILERVREGAIADGLESRGYTLSRIGSHSLRSGGAVRLKLAGADEGLIKKLGRWSGPTYKKYIQTLFTHLTKGLAEKMAAPLRYSNISIR